MKVALPLDKMTAEEKIKTMEKIWDDLCKKADSIPTPPWHKEVLRERENRIQKGEDKFLSWENAKEYIRRKTS